ncbi:MAG: hypothetical protein AB8B66_04820 [Rickettsiaceae bacterium]
MIHWLDESFVMAICFVIFVYIAYRPIKKVILNTLDTKIDQIKQQLHDTEQLKADAKLLLTQIQQEISSFEDQKQIAINNAQDSSSDFIKTKQIEIDKLITHKKEQALINIENEAKQYSSAMSHEFTETVVLLVKQYLAETSNNSVSDKQIMLHLHSKDE